MNTLLQTSERDVETKILKPLFTETLGYPEDNVHFDVPVSLTFGREKKTKKADLVAYYNGKPIVVVEAKKPTETLQSGIDQVDSYAFALESPYSIVTNGKDFVLRGYYAFNSRINIVEQSIDDMKRTIGRNSRNLYLLLMYSRQAKKKPIRSPDLMKEKSRTSDDFLELYITLYVTTISLILLHLSMK